MIGRTGLVVLLASLGAAGAAAASSEPAASPPPPEQAQPTTTPPPEQPAPEQSQPAPPPTPPDPEPPTTDPSQAAQPAAPAATAPEPSPPADTTPPSPPAPAAPADLGSSRAPAAAPPTAQLPPPAALSRALAAGPTSQHQAKASQGRFDECLTAPDPATCDRTLEQLDARRLSECPLSGSATPACRQANRDFESFRICVNEPDPATCAAQVAHNPCFQDASSDPCVRFIAVDRVEACNEDFSSPSFECQVVLAANDLYCAVTDAERCHPSGGGSEEVNSPEARAQPPSNQFATAGLSDPGARGDAGLQEVSAPTSTSKPAPKLQELPQTGEALWPLAVAGLLLLAAGLLAGPRRRPNR